MFYNKIIYYKKIWFIAIITLAASCQSTAHKKADLYFKNMEYLDAEKAYTKVLKTDPTNIDAEIGQALARKRLMQSQIEVITKARKENKITLAADFLNKVYEFTDAWPRSMDAQMQASLNEEEGYVLVFVKNEIIEALKSNFPLRAVAALDPHVPLLRRKEMNQSSKAIVKMILEAGHKSCSDFSSSTSKDDYFWGRIVQKYCRYWGEEGPLLMRTPDLLFSALKIEGSLTGLDNKSSKQIEEALLERIKETPWYLKSSKNKATLLLHGRIDITFSEQAKTINKPWNDSIPYESTEKYQEEFQEPFSSTEFYTEQVPYSASEAVSVPCAYMISGNCMSGTDYRTVTRYRTEMRSRPVTNYRTRYRTLIRPVTKYRQEPRTYVFNAAEVTASFTSEISGNLIIPGDGIVLPYKLLNESSEVGLRHDANFHPANVRPEQPSFTSKISWVSKQTDALSEQIKNLLVADWEMKFCRDEVKSRESTARCMALSGASDKIGMLKIVENSFGIENEILETILKGPSFLERLKPAVSK